MGRNWMQFAKNHYWTLTRTKYSTELSPPFKCSLNASNTRWSRIRLKRWERSYIAWNPCHSTPILCVCADSQHLGSFRTLDSHFTARPSLFSWSTLTTAHSPPSSTTHPFPLRHKSAKYTRKRCSRRFCSSTLILSQLIHFEEMPLWLGRMEVCSWWITGSVRCFRLFATRSKTSTGWPQKVLVFCGDSSAFSAARRCEWWCQ